MVDMVLMNSYFLNIFPFDKTTPFSIELLRIRIFPPTTASAIYTLSNKKKYSSRLQMQGKKDVRVVPSTIVEQEHTLSD